MLSGSRAASNEGLQDIDHKDVVKTLFGRGTD